jgi:hypothetical protein
MNSGEKRRRIIEAPAAMLPYAACTAPSNARQGKSDRRRFALPARSKKAREQIWKPGNHERSGIVSEVLYFFAMTQRIYLVVL